ncbi:MAG: hypothetical protein NWF00_01105 [Candidatus Bathyarchaeota archaeon]|nr:hypothetical protein [Candidatus Bathyarchaeota archaeon]
MESSSAFDLAHIVGLTFVPESGVYLLSASYIATVGLLLMLWHLLIGVKLYRLGRIQINGGERSE